MTNWIVSLSGNQPSDNRYLAIQNLTESARKIGFKAIHYILYEGLQNAPELRKQVIEGLFSQVRADDVVLLPFPLYILNGAFQKEVIDYLKLRTAVKIIGFVLDLHTWLRKETYDVQTDSLLAQLRNFDLLIVPTAKFAQRLKQDIVMVPMLSFDFLDFIYDGPLQTKKLQRKIYIASGRPIALKNYQGKTEITIIGQSRTQNTKVKTLPHRSAIELPMIFDGGFGAVDLIKNVTTNLGSYDWDHYSAYTSPSKLSLCLASGLPVLVRSDSAVSTLIERAGIGLIIDDLNELDARLEKLTQADYQEMLRKLVPYQSAVSSGNFAKRALIEALSFLRLGLSNSLV